MVGAEEGVLGGGVDETAKGSDGEDSRRRWGWWGETGVCGTICLPHGVERQGFFFGIDFCFVFFPPR